MDEVVKDRYNPAQWNIYAAQASDGDNWADDSPLCHEILAKKLLPVVRYYSYIEITRRAHQTLWREYEHLQSTFDNFAMQHIRDQMIFTRYSANCFINKVRPTIVNHLNKSARGYLLWLIFSGCGAFRSARKMILHPFHQRIEIFIFFLHTLKHFA